MAIATPMNAQATGLYCPHCDVQHVDAELFSRMGETSCANGHKFNDLAALRDMNCRKMPPKPQKERVQPGYQSVQVQMPPEVMVRLQERYGDKLGATLTTVMRVMCETRTYLVGNEDIARVEMKMGQKFTGVAQFIGTFIGKLQELADANVELDELRQKHGVSKTGTTTLNGEPANVRRGELVVWFDPGFTKILEEKAQDRTMSKEEFVEFCAKTGVEDRWV